MTPSAGTAMRWGRAAVLAAVAVTTGVVAHLSAGGLLPGPVGMLLILGTALLWAAALLGRPASARRVVVMVVACQTMTHLALTMLAGHRGDRPIVPGPTAGTATPVQLPTPQVTVMDGGRRAPWSEQMHAADPAAGGPVQLSVPAPVQHLIADFTGPHALMALAHLTAAAVVGLWLARGEQLAWSLVALTASMATSLVSDVALSLRGAVATPLLPRHGTVDTQAPEHGQTRPVRWFTVSRARRGPPVLAGC